jgi:hypothetical protein
MIISEMADGSKVAVGEVDHHSKLYTFSYFIPKSDYVTLITHAMKQIDKNQMTSSRKAPCIDARRI